MWRGTITALLMVVFLALFAGDWPAYLGDVARDGFNPGETINVTGLSQQWTYPQTSSLGPVVTQPLVDTFPARS